MSEFEVVRSDRTVWFVRRDEHGVIVEIREAQQAPERRAPGTSPRAQRHR
jgi:hypothetical protein